jgi:hypothetical protein
MARWFYSDNTKVLLHALTYRVLMLLLSSSEKPRIDDEQETKSFTPGTVVSKEDFCLRSFSENTQITVEKNQVSTALGDEAAILNLTNSVYYGLDPVGARIWNLIQQPKTFRELCDILLSEYEVDAPRLESDLQHLLNRLADEQLVQISG